MRETDVTEGLYAGMNESEWWSTSYMQSSRYSPELEEVVYEIDGEKQTQDLLPEEQLLGLPRTERLAGGGDLRETEGDKDDSGRGQDPVPDNKAAQGLSSSAGEDVGVAPPFLPTPH